MNREEILQIVQRIMDCDGSEQEVDELIDRLEVITGHPKVVEMIFYPDKELSAEEITAELLTYTPLRLPNKNEI